MICRMNRIQSVNRFVSYPVHPVGNFVPSHGDVRQGFDRMDMIFRMNRSQSVSRFVFYLVNPVHPVRNFVPSHGMFGGDSTGWT